MSAAGQLWATSSRADVLDSLRRAPLTFRELMEDTGAVESTLRRSLYSLRDQGMVTSDGGEVTTERGATAKTWAITPLGLQALMRTETLATPRRPAPKAAPTPSPVPDESSTSQEPGKVPAERKQRRRREDPLTLDEASVALWLAADAIRARRIVEQVRQYWNGVTS